MLIELENKILRLIASGASVESTMQALCGEVERLLPELLCTIASVEAGGILRLLAAPSLPESFFALVDGTVIGPEAGSCGTAAFLREPILTTHIQHDPKWARYRELCWRHGLAACWSAPVTGDTTPAVAVVGFYFRRSRQPSDAERAAMAVCVDLCAVAWRRLARIALTEKRANIDALTGLPNRRTFNSALASLPCDSLGAWAIVVADLDNLKTVNDTFGHKSGDELLKEAAKRIAHASLPDLTFRLGGDEFAIIVQCPEALSDLDRFASRIFDVLEQPADCAGQSVVPRATMGGASFDTIGARPKTVQDSADFALYHAKETGRGGFVRYWPGIGSRIARRLGAISEVSAALAEGRIDAHYQPVVRLDTREVVGVEALCRLRTGAEEIGGTDFFLEATTDAHVAIQLTDRMLGVIAQDVRTWIDEGIPFQYVSLNISAADLFSGDLNQRIAASFGKAGVALRHLILELDESLYFAGREKIVACEIGRLRHSGLRIALDDFGSGYASLTQLLNAPFDAIKVDKSFTSRLSPGEPGAIVVAGLIKIARELGVYIVAEGVEADGQAGQLLAMGCLVGQGRYFSGPLDRLQMTKLLHHHAQGAADAYNHHSKLSLMRSEREPAATSSESALIGRRLLRA